MLSCVLTLCQASRLGSLLTAQWCCWCQNLGLEGLLPLVVVVLCARTKVALAREEWMTTWIFKLSASSWSIIFLHSALIEMARGVGDRLEELFTQLIVAMTIESWALGVDPEETESTLTPTS